MSDDVLNSESVFSSSEPVESPSATEEVINVSKTDLEVLKDKGTTQLKCLTSTVKNNESKEAKPHFSELVPSHLSDVTLNTKQGDSQMSEMGLHVAASGRGQNSESCTQTVENALDTCKDAIVLQSLKEPASEVHGDSMNQSGTNIEAKSGSIDINLGSSHLVFVQFENKDSRCVPMAEFSKDAKTEENQKMQYPGDDSSPNSTLNTDDEKPAKQRKLDDTCMSELSNTAVPERQNLTEANDLSEDIIFEACEKSAHTHDTELQHSDHMDTNKLIRSPDGSCLLTCSNDCSLRLFNLPAPLLHGQTENLDEMCSVLCMKEGETIYDYSWYPLMTSNEPATCCLVSTSSNTPVHMWDAFTGELRCSYRAFNQMDEVTAAYSVAFNSDGSKLFTGFNKMIRVFDVNRPGRDCQERPTYVKEGQSGIISCIVQSPSQPSLYAAGSYSRSVALYNDSVGDMVCMFEGHQGGVTHIQFTPDGNKLLSGARKDPEILCWDLRYPGQILFIVQRDVLTNQRIYFDVDWSGRYLISGNHDGTVRIWDMSQPLTESSSGSDPVLKPILSYQAHWDTVNGVSFHPSMPLLATSSGQRHFKDLSVESDEETEELTKVDNSVRLWCTV